VARPDLNREKIVATAIRIADEQRLEAVTLRSIARRLGVHVTSLYNHIPSKDAVLEEMIDALVAEADLPVGPLTWQDWIRRLAAAMRALAKRHPGAFQLFLRRPARGVQALESLESVIAAFRLDGFDAVSTYCAIKAVNVTVIGLIVDDLARHLHPVLPPESGRFPGDGFPNVAEIQAAAGEADSFGFVLDALIDGLAANRRHDSADARRPASTTDRTAGSAGSGRPAGGGTARKPID